VKVGWKLNVSTLQRADLRTAQVRNEIAEFKDDILACTRLQLAPVLLTADIISREKDDCEANVAVRLHLFDYGATLAGFLVEDDRIKAERLQKSGTVSLAPSSWP
jgi:hypothetical protein